MEKYSDLKEINHLLHEMNAGGVESYDQDDQALVLRLESNGGIREGQTFFLKFNYVELFQLPLSLNVSVHGKSIDRLCVVDECDLSDVLPNIDEDITYKNNDYRCYRFHAEDIPTNFYVYCLSVEGLLD